MKKIKGNLVTLAEQGQFDVIIHGCNCFCTFGKGLALEIKDAFREAYFADCRTNKGDRGKLGQYTRADLKIYQPGSSISQRLIVINAYTQYDYRGNGVLVDYTALDVVFWRIKRDFSGLRIGLPMIGAGLARGDWTVIEKIICEKLKGEDFTIIEFGK